MRVQNAIALNIEQFIYWRPKKGGGMENIFYLRGFVSCLPIVGPFAGLYNTLEVKNQLFPPL